MSIKTRVVLAAITTTFAVALVLHATPTVGQVFAILSTGTSNDEILAHSRVPLPPVSATTSDDGPNEWIANLFTSGPTTFQVLDVTLLPNGHTGWHHHPAILLSSMISGSIEWYDVQCNKHVYNAGDSWTENAAIHDVRNVGTTNAHFMITYIIAKGQPRRIDEPAPACAAALGLE
jgi:quercetin dioxygenase-like cupin family protein